MKLELLARAAPMWHATNSPRCSSALCLAILPPGILVSMCDNGWSCVTNPQSLVLAVRFDAALSRHFLRESRPLSVLSAGAWRSHLPWSYKTQRLVNSAYESVVVVGVCGKCEGGGSDVTGGNRTCEFVEILSGAGATTEL